MTNITFAGPRKELTCLAELILAILYLMILLFRVFMLVHFHHFLVNYHIGIIEVRTPGSWLGVERNYCCIVSTSILSGLGGLFHFKTRGLLQYNLWAFGYLAVYLIN
jgi:hypothetical protein